MKLALDVTKLLFIDIETVRGHKYFNIEHFEQFENRKPKKSEEKLIFELVDKRGFDIFESKRVTHQSFRQEDRSLTPVQFYSQKAGIWAEFSKVVAITVAYERNGKLKVNSLYDHDEKSLLLKFRDIANHKMFIGNVPVDYKTRMEIGLDMYKDDEIIVNTFKGDVTFVKEKGKWYEKDKCKMYPCGHNVDSFDLPFLYKRYLAKSNGLYPPKLIAHSYEPRYTNNSYDTMKFLNNMSRNGNATLDTLTWHTGIASPKGGEVKGSEVSDCYYCHGKFSDATPDENLKRIADYCERDVVALYYFINYVNDLN